MYCIFFKRIIDFLIAIFGLIFTLPLLLILSLILVIVNKGSAFFTQDRPGRNRKIFRLVKFKTMNNKKNLNGELLSDRERLTSVGRFIRATSLDELPQLINVVKGDMALIGPRPLLIKYLPLYNDRQSRRHEVRPGITGWAQINGRNAISWEQKFEYDVWYVDHISFRLDIRILWMTFIKVFKREGINSATATTMETFKGNRKLDREIERNCEGVNEEKL